MVGDECQRRVVGWWGGGRQVVKSEFWKVSSGS